MILSATVQESSSWCLIWVRSAAAWEEPPTDASCTCTLINITSDVCTEEVEGTSLLGFPASLSLRVLWAPASVGSRTPSCVQAVWCASVPVTHTHTFTILCASVTLHYCLFVCGVQWGAAPFVHPFRPHLVWGVYSKHKWVCFIDKTCSASPTAALFQPEQINMQLMNI